MFWFIMIFSTWKLDCFCFKWLGFDIFFIDVDLIILPWIWHCFFIDLDLIILTWIWHCFFFMNLDLIILTWSWHCFFLWTWIWLSWLGFDIVFLIDVDLIILTWSWHYFCGPGFDYPDLILTFFVDLDLNIFSASVMGCEELGIQSSEVEKLRKMPNTRWHRACP